MKAVIVGTGATSGTLGAKGGVAEFPSRLNTVHRDWRARYPNLAKLVRDSARPGEREDQLGLDRIWTRIDYYSKLRRILGSDYGGDAAMELRQAVSDAYAFKDEIDQLTRVRTDFTLKSVLDDLSAGDTLISFNWDTLAETVAQTMLGKDLVQAPHPGADTAIRFLKPHGSLSWEHRALGDRIEVTFRDGPRPRLELVSARTEPAGFVQPLLLGAVPIKSELLEEVQSYSGHDRVHQLIAEQWREVIDAISKATTIVFVGYSLPAEDAYGRFLFEEALRRRRPLVIAPVVKYYSRSASGKVTDNLESLFGKGNCKFVSEVRSAW